MHESLKDTDHRPWPLPAGKWLWRQSWLDLAFIHYRVDPEQLLPLLPAGVTLQRFDGSAWVGVVPFRMEDMMVRQLPAIYPMARFPELNVRTYVEVEGKPGVWFFSLDAACRPLVMGARALYGLPYHRAAMRQWREDDWFVFESSRRSGGADFAARYRPVGEVAPATPGSFAHWSAERYCLYAQRWGGQLVRLQVHHPAWPLQQAEVRIENNGMLKACGIDPLEELAICSFSPGVHVVSFTGEVVQPSRRPLACENPSPNS